MDPEALKQVRVWYESAGARVYVMTFTQPPAYKVANSSWSATGVVTAVSDYRCRHVVFINHDCPNLSPLGDPYDYVRRAMKGRLGSTVSIECVTITNGHVAVPSSRSRRRVPIRRLLELLKPGSSSVGLAAGRH